MHLSGLARHHIEIVKPMKKTILTELAELPETEAMKEHRWRVSRLEGIAHAWVEGYSAGDVGFEEMVRAVHRAARAAKLEDAGIQSWLGYAVHRALAKEPQKPGRANGLPKSFEKLAHGLVSLIAEREEVSRKPARGEPKRKSVYDRAAELFSDAGVPRVTARVVEDLASRYRKAAKERDD